MGDIIFDHVNKDYRMGEVTIHAAKQVSFHVKKGELCIILGPSGAGKTTVLNLLGGMEIATSGRILFGGKDITAMNDLELTDYRRYKIGFVFQFYNLIPNLTAAENVELAKQVCKSSLEPEEALRIVGLKDRIHDFRRSFPAENSSVSRLPGQSAKIPTFCFATNLPAPWIPKREKRF